MNKAEHEKLITYSETVLAVCNDVAVISKTLQEKYDDMPENIQSSGDVDHLFDASAQLEEIAQELHDLHTRLQKVEANLKDA